MKSKNDISSYMYLAPALVLAFLFTFYPFLKAFVSSFLTLDSAGRILGFAFLDNYKLLFVDSSFHNAIKNTLVFTILFVPLNIFLVLLASALTRRKNRFSFIAEYIFFLPMAFSLSSATLVFSRIFSSRVSIANRILGTNFDWLNESLPAMLVLVFLGVFLDFGIDYILLLTSFRSSDKSILEAARLDGATGSKLFFYIELPLIKGMLYVIIFLSIKDALLMVAPVTILTEGGPFGSTETIMFYYYIEAFKSGNMAIGNTLTVILVLFSFVSLFLFTKIRGEK